MSSDITTDMQPAMHQVTQSCSQPSTLACSYACMQSTMQADMQAESKKRCPLGLSSDQINIISIVKNASLPLSYKDIATLMLTTFQSKVTEGIVRGAVNRLKSNGLLQSRYDSLGNRRGNVYTIMPLVCPYIPSIDMQASMQFAMSPTMQAAPSILIDRIDSNLSILNACKQRLEALTEEDMAFHWENLAHKGFGTHQIRQIISRLEQVNIPLENVMQGLNHAEWELEHQQMKDKHGNLITSPVDWVFKILAKQGYYPRPKEYISPIEQAEQDALQDAQAIQEAKKACRKLAYETWLSNLSAEEQRNIIEAHKQTSQSAYPMPDAMILEIYFEKEVWPHHQDAANKIS